MPEKHVEKTIRRSKSKFDSARAAWRDIEKDTGIRPSGYRLKRQDTDAFYAWKVIGRKRGVRPSNPFKGRM